MKETGRVLINNTTRKSIISYYKNKGKECIYQYFKDSISSKEKLQSCLTNLFQEQIPDNGVERIYYSLKFFEEHKGQEKLNEIIYEIAEAYIKRGEYGYNSIVSYTISQHLK